MNTPMWRRSRSTEKPRIISSSLVRMTVAPRGHSRGSSDRRRQKSTVRSGQRSENSRKIWAAANTPSAAYAVGIIQPGAPGPRSAKNAPNTNSDTSKPSTTRSTATVPSAAEADSSPRLRMRAGRTNSPSRAGRARMAMKPTDDTAHSRP